MIKVGQTTTNETITLPYELTNDGDTSISLQELKGNTTQNGTPTPTSPVDVKVAKSPNLYTGRDISITTSWYFQDKLLLKNFENNATYTISFDIQATREPFQISIGYGNSGFQKDGPSVSNRTNGHQSFTFTTSNDTYTNLWMRIPRYSTQDGEWSATITNIQLERGAFETTPHNSMICKVIGKNLFDLSSMIGTTQVGVTLTQDTNGKFELNGTATNTGRWRVELPQDIDYPITLYLKAQDNNGNIMLSLRNSSATQLVAMRNTATTMISNYTPTSPVHYIEIAQIGTSASYTNYKFEVMVVKGTYNSSTIGEYEPYKSNNYPITLGDIELCKIGTYQDRFYKQGDKWYLEKKVGKKVYVGAESEQWGQYTTNIYRTIKITEIRNCLSNYYAFNSTEYMGQLQDGQFGIANSSNAFALCVKNTSISSTTDFKTWLSTHNLIVYYPLATPTTTEITDDTLLEQLDAIGELYRGTNNIMITDTIAPVENIIIEKSNAEFDLVPYIKREPKIDYIDRKGDTGYTADGHYFENIIARKRAVEFELIPMSQDNYLSVISHFIDKTQIPVYIDDLFTGETNLINTWRKEKIPTKQITENGIVRGTTIKLEEI